METVKAETDGVHIDGVLHLQFLYVREDDQTPFGVWNGMVPFSYLLENGGGEPDMEDMDCTVEQLSVNLMGSGEVEVKAVLAFNCFQKEPVPRKACKTGTSVIHKTGQKSTSIIKR